MKKVDEKIDEKPAKERVDNYIKHKNGAIFLVTENTRNSELVFLVNRKNKMNSFSKKDISQGLIDGEWLRVNEHEVKAWDKVYTENMLRLTQKVLKHVMMAELLIAVDEDLNADNIGDRYFRNLLHKSNKQAMRIADKHFDNLFRVDSVILQNMLRVIEKLVKNISELPLEDYPYFEKFTEKYFENPKAYRNQKVEFVKPEE